MLGVAQGHSLGCRGHGHLRLLPRSRRCWGRVSLLGPTGGESRGRGAAGPTKAPRGTLPEPSPGHRAVGHPLPPALHPWKWGGPRFPPCAGTANHPRVARSWGAGTAPEHPGSTRKPRGAGDPCPEPCCGVSPPPQAPPKQRPPPLRRGHTTRVPLRDIVPPSCGRPMGTVVLTKGGTAPMKGGLRPQKGGSAPIKGGVCTHKGGSAPTRGGVFTHKAGSAPIRGGLHPQKGGQSPSPTAFINLPDSNTFGSLVPGTGATPPSLRELGWAWGVPPSPPAEQGCAPPGAAQPLTATAPSPSPVPADRGDALGSPGGGSPLLPLTPRWAAEQQGRGQGPRPGWGPPAGPPRSSPAPGPR